MNDPTQNPNTSIPQAPVSTFTPLPPTQEQTAGVPLTEVTPITTPVSTPPVTVSQTQEQQPIAVPELPVAPMPQIFSTTKPVNTGKKMFQITIGILVGLAIVGIFAFAAIILFKK